MDRFVENLATAGNFDSQGEFTIGWERAVSKLRSYQAGDPQAYLLALVSAAHAFGADRISITENSSQLELRLFEAYVPEVDLLRGFESIRSGQAESDALDLAMGLHGGLRDNYERVNVTALHPEKPSYRWSLTSESEQSAPQSLDSAKSVLLITFLKRGLVMPGSGFWARLFGRDPGAGSLGGYAGMSDVCRKVDSRCELSNVPITINGHLVNRPLHLPQSEVAVRIGELTGVYFHSPKVLEVDGDAWQGALVSGEGAIQPVINGVAYPSIAHPSLQGTVWTQLNRDFSRQRILQDQRYQDFQTELSRIETLVRESG